MGLGEKQPRGGGPGIYGGQQVWMEALQEFVHSQKERKREAAAASSADRPLTLINC